MGDAALSCLGGEFANALLRLLQSLAHDVNDIDGDLGMAAYQLQQFGLAPARLQRFADGDGVSGITTVGEQRYRAEHLAGPDEADNHLGAIAAGLCDAHPAFDHGMGAHAVIALVEDQTILAKAPHAGRGRNRLQSSRRDSEK